MKNVMLFAVLAAFAITAVTARADIVVNVYETTDVQAQDARTIPGGATLLATGVFTSLNFDSTPFATPTLSQFLNSGGTAVGSITYTAAAGSGGSLLIGSLITTNNGFMISATGTSTFTAGSHSITHDDGVQLVIGGTTQHGALNCASPLQAQPCLSYGPVSATTESYVTAAITTPTSFTLTYGECCKLPAVLKADTGLQTPVPEPTSVLLLGTAFLGVSALLRKKFQSS